MSIPQKITLGHTFSNNVIVPSKIEPITILINNYMIVFSIFYYFNQILNDNPTRIIIELGVCVF